MPCTRRGNLTICSGGDIHVCRDVALLVQDWYEPVVVLRRRKYERQTKWRERCKAKFGDRIAEE